MVRRGLNSGTAVAMGLLMLASALVGIYIATATDDYAVVIMVVDDAGAPVKGAVVQLFAIAPPYYNTSSIEVFRGKTDDTGSIKLRLEGELKKIARQWRAFLENECEGHSKTFYTALRIFITYENEKGLYLVCGKTLLYSPGEMLEGVKYVRRISVDLSEEPVIPRERLEEWYGGLGYGPSSPPPSEPYFIWVLEKTRIYPKPTGGPPDYYDYYTPTARIPITWSDSRYDSYPPAVHGVYNIWLEAGYKERIGVYAGACLGMGVRQFGARAEYKFEIADMTIAEKNVRFSKTNYIVQGRFTWTYIRAQIRYDEYQLYYYYPGPPPWPPVMYPTDTWWFESYISYYKTSGGKIVGGAVISDEPPDILDELYEGYDYDLFGSYRGQGTYAPHWEYHVDNYDIEERYVPEGTQASERYELGVSLGVMFFSLIAKGTISGGLTLPLSLLAFLTGSWAIEGRSDIKWWVEFDAPLRSRIYMYVAITEVKFTMDWHEFHVPVLGLQWRCY